MAGGVTLTKIACITLLNENQLILMDRTGPTYSLDLSTGLLIFLTVYRTAAQRPFPDLYFTCRKWDNPGGKVRKGILVDLRS